jgi:HSP20 family protein|tara:strand:- start:3028 stop:3450 length:423 start_codon:yes stop_codon:yes gene_type:complete
MNLLTKKQSLFPIIFDDFFKNSWDINVPNCNENIPSFNVKENEKEFVLELAVPGAKNKDFKVEIDNRLLSVSNINEKVKSDYNYTFKEFEFSSFEKSFELPVSVERDKISSFYRNGILSITLPKRKEFQDFIKKIISVNK